MDKASDTSTIARRMKPANTQLSNERDDFIPSQLKLPIAKARMNPSSPAVGHIQDFMAGFFLPSGSTFECICLA